MKRERVRASGASSSGGTTSLLRSHVKFEYKTEADPAVKRTYRQSVIRAATQTAHNSRWSKRNANPKKRKGKLRKALMAFSKVMLFAVMSVLVAVLSVADAADAPAPSPASPAAAISPSFAAGCIAAVAALAFGSSLRI
ncbi:hypothetical protein VNO77_32418 [Canavalia gladiata]|uniref:Uncharacterized protein n=1 Tax=Canavalia gladiata TaxID=3824 RepID=A0AAN9KUA6_CANGL